MWHYQTLLFVGPVAGGSTIHKQQIWRRRIVFALCQQNAWNFKYGGHCNGQIICCKNRATLGREREGTRYCLANFKCKIWLHGTIIYVKAHQALNSDATIMTLSPHFLPNAAQKAICWMFGASWMVALGENMQVWTSNTGGVMKISMKVQILRKVSSPRWFVDGSQEGINSRWCPISLQMWWNLAISFISTVSTVFDWSCLVQPWPLELSRV